MISEGAVNDSLSKVKKLLKHLNLLYKVNTTRPMTLDLRKFSSAFLREMQSTEYLKIYKIARENSDYDFLLKDGSFFQFSILENESEDECVARFAFYQTSFKKASFDDFIKEMGNDVNVMNDQFTDDFDILFSQFQDEAEQRENVTPIRYDFNPSEHKVEMDKRKKEKQTVNYHSTAHIHIGTEQSMRVPVRRELTPLEFSVFVIRMMYYEKFERGIVDDRCRKLMTEGNTSELNANYFCSDEEKQLFLTYK